MSVIDFTYLAKMALEIDLEEGDVILGGRFKNIREVVEKIGTDKIGQPTVNGKKLLTVRIEKKLPDEKKSKETLASMNKDAGAWTEMAQGATQVAADTKNALRDILFQLRYGKERGRFLSKSVSKAPIKVGSTNVSAATRKRVQQLRQILEQQKTGNPIRNLNEFIQGKPPVGKILPAPANPRFGVPQLVLENPLTKNIKRDISSLPTDATQVMGLVG